MITEDYVSFEIAKLLKEKGFNEETEHELWYATKQFSTGCHWNSCTYKVGDITREYNDDCCIPMPTLQMACKWLREVHKLNIEFILNQYVQNEETVIKNYYHFNVSRLDRFANEGGDCKFYNSYEEAVENAIKYCLENLI